MSLIVNNIDKNWWYEGVPIRARTRRAKPGTAKAAATSCLSRTLDIGVLVICILPNCSPDLAEWNAMFDEGIELEIGQSR
jgi:hypothetical protein